MREEKETEFIGEHIINEQTPLMPYHRCHCHTWRFDECPNTGVALLIRKLRIRKLRDGNEPKES